MECQLLHNTPLSRLLSNTLHQTTASWLSSLDSVAAASHYRRCREAPPLDRPIAFPRTALAGGGQPTTSPTDSAAITHGGGDDIKIYYINSRGDPKYCSRGALLLTWSSQHVGGFRAVSDQEYVQFLYEIRVGDSRAGLPMLSTRPWTELSSVGSNQNST